MTLTEPVRPAAIRPAEPWTGGRDLRPSIRGTSQTGVDWLLCFCAFALACIGAVLVWSSTKNQFGTNAYLVRHLVNMVIGIGLVIALAKVDRRLLRLLGPALYVASCLGLVAVLLFGTTVNGAHAWIRFPAGVEVQPAEFAKLGLILGLAVLFGQRSIGRPVDASPRAGDILSALGLALVPLGLIMLQPDLGSALVVGAAAFGVLLAAGVPARWTVGLLVIGVLGAILAVKTGVLAEYQLARFRAFTDPHSDTQGAAYNITQARIAIAHGGLLGKGLFHGPQTQGGFVPEQQTDFVFSAAGEELGFVGSLAIIGLYGVLLWRALRIAAGADRIGRLVATGVVCWFAFQTFQNIGMNLGMTPVTGLPLPFVSYGGSSMFAGALAIGMLLVVRRGSDLFAPSTLRR
ncbi:MAG: rod shape-determining protein RodA [Jatrophihabitans sp.]